MFLRPTARRLLAHQPRLPPTSSPIAACFPARASLVTHPKMSTEAASAHNQSQQQQQQAPAAAAAPIESSIRTKLTTALSPSTLEINNDSHLHAHHAAMQSGAYATAKETHFRLRVVSEAFAGKMQPARHRMVYALLKEEMQAEGGVHALQLVTRTAEEEERAAAKKG